MNQYQNITLCYPCEHHRPAQSSDSSAPIWPSTTPMFWERLEARDPDQAAACAGAALDEDGSFLVESLGETWRVDCGTKTVAKVQGHESAPWDRELPFIILVYLANAQETGLSGDMTPPWDLFQGINIFQSTLTLKTDWLVDHFGKPQKDFSEPIDQLKGRSIDGADAGGRFMILPKFPVEFRLWFADEEFPAEAKILVDRATPKHLPADAMAVAMNHLIERICKG